MGVLGGNRDILKFFLKTKNRFIDVCRNEVRALRSVKVQFGLEVRFYINRNDEVEYMSHYFNRMQPIVLNEHNMDTLNYMLNQFVDEVRGEIEAWSERGSGWVVDEILEALINVAHYQPLNGGSYMPLPEKLKNKKAILNIQNRDNQCLRWAIRAALFPAPRGLNPQRPSSYPTNEYMDSFERFDETELPEKEKFYSSLSGKGITDEKYSHAKDVWSKFGCQNLGNYHDLYVATDVLLLAEVFENFRKVCQDKYGLDPAHYYSAPGLSWDALLKKTGVELELLTDLDMHLFIQWGMRGGISMVSKRHAKANNPLVEGHDPDKPTNYIKYLDANNVYGWAMSLPLPKTGFHWEGCPIHTI